MAAVREQDAPVSLPSRNKTRPVVPLAASRRQVIAKKTQRPSTLQRRPVAECQDYAGHRDRRA